MMKRINKLTIRYLCVTALLLLPRPVFSQQQNPATEQGDVIRISTELVQTGVTVIDKQGRFVDGLTPEQFELRVDGKPVTFSFFDRVTAGTSSEARQVVAATKGSSPNQNLSSASLYGRAIIFFLDDLHLSAPSVEHTRKAILDFIDKEMGPDDQVAIASASGQIGFLQSFTNVKAVLRAAIARVTPRPYIVHDTEIISMTEYQALRISQGDRDATDYFVTELLKATRNDTRGGGGLGPPSGGPANSGAAARNTGSIPGMNREMAERNVRERAQFMMKQSASVTASTLAGLESLMRASSQLLGRKLVFFVSDGFYLNDSDTGFNEKLRQITDAAVRAGVVIYAIDARGMTSMTDARSNQADGMGRLARANIGELSISQNPLTSLSSDTGGRALLNSELFDKAVSDALAETGNYYLLAWRPPTEEQKGGNYKRIEVTIVGRPDLIARVPKGFLLDPKTNDSVGQNKNQPAPPKTAEAALIAALGSGIAKRGLATRLALSFLDVPGSGTVLTASTQIATARLSYGADGKQPAAVDLVGLILNDQGKPAGNFKTRLNVNPLPTGKVVDDASVIYNYKTPLKPGIYQVRVAARDDKSTEVGSTADWIEIPDLGSKRLMLSTLLLGGQFVGSAQDQTNSGQQIQFSVDRRFTRGSHLNLLTIVYNAGKSNGGAPDLTAQIKISQNGRSIVTSPQLRVGAEPKSDLERILYGADVALQTLPPGRYLLQVTISDRVANTSAAQEITFEIV